MSLNVVDHDTAVLVQPCDTEPSGSDTLDFTQNWWGTTSIQEVEARILSLPFGEHQSMNHLALEPIALEEF